MLQSLGPITQHQLRPLAPSGSGEIPQPCGATAASCFLVLLSVTTYGLFLFQLLERRTQLLQKICSDLRFYLSILYCIFSVDFMDAQQGGVLLMDHLTIRTLLGFSLLLFLPVSSLVQKPPCSPESEVPHSSSSLTSQLQLQVVCQGIFF